MPTLRSVLHRPHHLLYASARSTSAEYERQILDVVSQTVPAWLAGLMLRDLAAAEARIAELEEYEAAIASHREWTQAGLDNV